jgi:tetratricopeptide (TPR) repeat protein
MMRTLLKVVIGIMIFLNISCATKVVTFKTEGPAKVALLTSGKLNIAEDPLGETPITVDLDRLTGKVVKISQPGKSTVFWVVSEAAGEVTEANISLVDVVGGQAASGGAQGETNSTKNSVLRLILKSYQALSGKRFDTARELADQAAAINPEIAAPHLLKGLAFFQEGKLDEARVALTKAQALDPEDKEIADLLTVVAK